jgi:hypothetical protein
MNHMTEATSGPLANPMAFRPEPVMREMVAEFAGHERRSMGGAIRELLRFALQEHGYWPGFEVVPGPREESPNEAN